MPESVIVLLQFLVNLAHLEPHACLIWRYLLCIPLIILESRPMYILTYMHAHVNHPCSFNDVLALPHEKLKAHGQYLGCTIGLWKN